MRRGRPAQARALLYSFFAQALSPPTKALVMGGADGSLRAALDAALAAAPHAHRRACQASIDGALVGLEAATGADDELQVEYARLFGNGVVCPHYETAYVSTDVFRDVHVVAEVAGVYEAHGVRVAESIGERPDYIAVELEFMNFLSTKQARASMHVELSRVRQCREMQRQFLTDHLGLWVRPFCSRLAEVARLPFYREVAGALVPFIDAETSYLGVPARPDAEPPPK